MRTPEYRVWITAPKEDWLGADDYDTFDWNNRMRMVASMHFPLGSYSGKDITAEAISEPDYYAQGWLSAEYSYEDTVRPSEFILMEYIGLKDKNGVKIFDGDIVEAWSAGSKGIFQVKWRQEGSPCWLLYPNFQERQHWSIHATEHKVGKQLISVDGKITTTDLDGFYDDGLTVIGNIHQDPELLK